MRRFEQIPELLPLELHRVLALIESRFENLNVRYESDRKFPFWTTTIIVANTLLFLLSELQGGSDSLPVLLTLGAMLPSLVTELGQWWRIFTTIFLHHGFAHLLANMLALYFLGPALEARLGALRYVILYFVSGLGSAAFIVFLTQQGFLEERVTVGASGGIMGLIGATAVILYFNWRRHRQAEMFDQLKSVLTIIGLQAILDILVPNISFSAHFGGLILGAACISLFLGLESFKAKA